MECKSLVIYSLEMPHNYLLITPEGESANEQADEWVRLGIEAALAGNGPNAERFFRRALTLDPNSPVATHNLAAIFAQYNNFNEALLTVERASALDGVNPWIYRTHALIALELDRIDIALEKARKAVELKPDVNTRMPLALIAGTAGLSDESVEQYREVLKEAPQDSQAGLNCCFAQTLTMATPEKLLEQRKAWHQAHRFTGAVEPHPALTKKDTLRVGYVSGDFKTHSAAMIFGAVVLNHDKQRIAPYLYSTLLVDPVADAMTKSFKEFAGDNWYDVTKLNDEQMAALIRGHGIDILVDLSAHTGGSRLPVFTRKPAPIQVTGWGFAHGTGCPEIDYFFADPVAVPEAERKFYAEKIWDLPCIVSYLPREDEKKILPTTSRLPYHQNGYITFGSYARYEKLSDACLRTYAQILEKVPKSRLQFKDHAFRRPYAINRVKSFMPGIEPKRLLFQLATDHPQHMRAHQQADVILDPWPHGGGVVALEQLYMGVPMVTMYGTQPAGRTASSVLTAMGCPGWIARTTHQYVEIACELAGDISRISTVRETLHDTFMKSPVIAGYREAVEAAYFQMWEKRIG